MAEDMAGNMSNLVKTTVDELLKVLATDNVIGETMEVEDKVIIPLTKIGLAFGSGSAQGGMMRGQTGGGAGAGGGAGIEPVSVIVAFKDVKGPEGVQILSVQGMGPVAKLAADLGHGVRTMVEKEGGPSGMMKKGKEMMGKKGEESKEGFKEPGTM